MVECLAVQLFAKWSEWSDGSRSRVSLEQQPVTGAFELLELSGERALACTECLGCLGQAVMLGDDDEAGEALTSVSADEHGSQRFGNLRGVDPGRSR